MGTSIEELQAENDILRQEIRVAREAAEITSELVVKQFVFEIAEFELTLEVIDMNGVHVAEVRERVRHA